MAQLEGKNVVVAGGTGRVGEGLVRSFLMEGARVIVPVRSTSKEQRLRSYLEGVETGRLFLSADPCRGRSFDLRVPQTGISGV
jgi:NAD(P)-dependent dehydrogenase (short-subunit alcohol dehydrogenase family)